MEFSEVFILFGIILIRNVLKKLNVSVLMYEMFDYIKIICLIKKVLQPLPNVLLYFFTIIFEMQEKVHNILFQPRCHLDFVK
jgi:hypothetical protein